MFERFTEKAIKVITYSQEEASIAGHPRLYPEHILLGIMREGTGIAARFLRTADLKVDVLRDKINDSIVIKQGEKTLFEGLAFSSAAKKVLQKSSDVAKSLRTNYINPEHLFLALLSEDNSTIINLLKDFNVDIERIKSSVIRVVEQKAKTSSHPEDSLKSQSFVSKYFFASTSEESELNQIISSAKEILYNSSYEILGTEQILLAMLENKDSSISVLLENEGINLQNFSEKLENINTRSDEYFQNELPFTPKAYFAIDLAHEYAKELGSTDLKPEHLLLGILGEKSGLAYRVLKELGLDTTSLFNKVLKPIEKQKPETLTIVRLAREEARKLGHNAVGTEQILLGIIGEGTGIGASVLKDLGITLKDARIEVEKIIGIGNCRIEKETTLTPRVKKLLEIAWEKAKKYSSQRIESEHLLLGITKEKECMAMKVLQNLGVDVLEIRQGILKAIEKKNRNQAVNID
ncbi:MAG: Clp protease N-terminal domain-containing protein [Candidatus Gastranaerophilales bacterium]|nr:Clp protease N-terminal domain-containing protein [Candidatus Gastranaerophilales bacterium]